MEGENTMFPTSPRYNVESDAAVGYTDTLSERMCGDNYQKLFSVFIKFKVIICHSASHLNELNIP